MNTRYTPSDRKSRSQEPLQDLRRQPARSAGPAAAGYRQERDLRPHGANRRRLRCQLCHQRGRDLRHHGAVRLGEVHVLVPGKDVVWLQVPFSSLPGERKDVDTTLPDGSNYGFQANDQRIVANREFAEAHPDAAKLFSIMRVSSNDISAQNLRMRDGEDSAKDIERHADAWIRANQEKFDAWIAEAKKAAE